VRSAKTITHSNDIVSEAPCVSNKQQYVHVVNAVSGSVKNENIKIQADNPELTAKVETEDSLQIKESVNNVTLNSNNQPRQFSNNSKQDSTPSQSDKADLTHSTQNLKSSKISNPYQKLPTNSIHFILDSNVKKWEVKTVVKFLNKVGLQQY
jgi:hypothetical protein